MVGIMNSAMLKKVYANFQSQGDVLLFCLFLFIIPFSIRKVVWFLPLYGGFNEYADVSLYFSDLVFGAIMITNFCIYKNVYKNLSIYMRSFFRNMSRVSLAHKLNIFLPAVLIAWSLCSLLFAQQFIIGVFFVLKLIEWYVMFLFIIFRIVPRRTGDIVGLFRIQLIFKSIIFSGVLQSLIGILQMIHQKSIGLVLFKESIIGSDVVGVAKIVFNNEVYVRAYGMFPHPNILGGFLFLSIMITHLYFKMFHVEQKGHIIFKIAIFLIQYIGILLTFSKSALLGLMISLVYVSFILMRVKSKNKVDINYQSNFMSRLSGRKKYSVGVLFGIVMFASIGIGMSMFDRDALLFQSLRERAWYQSIAFDIIQKHPILGISCGQLVIFMSQQRIYPLLNWQLQPVHNVFLLIWSELGVIGFGIFSLWWVLFLGIYLKRKKSGIGIDNESMDKSVCKMNQCNWFGIYGYGILLGIIPILLFDHYLWDIQQGQFIMWFATGLFSGFILYHKTLYNTTN